MQPTNANCWRWSDRWCGGTTGGLGVAPAVSGGNKSLARRRERGAGAAFVRRNEQSGHDWIVGFKADMAGNWAKLCRFVLAPSQAKVLTMSRIRLKREGRAQTNFNRSSSRMDTPSIGAVNARRGRHSHPLHQFAAWTKAYRASLGL